MFSVLERIVQKACSAISAYPAETWQRLTESDALAEAIEEDLDERHGVVDFTTNVDDPASDVVMRVFFPFRIWPLGGWAVYEGWHRNAGAKWVRFTQDELAKLW